MSYTDALPIKKIRKMLKFPVTDLSRLSRWCLKCENKVDFQYVPKKPSEKNIERKIENNKNENQINMINRNKYLNKKSTFDEPTLPESTPKKLQQNMLKMIDRNKKSND